MHSWGKKTEMSSQEPEFPRAYHARCRLLLPPRRRRHRLGGLKCDLFEWLCSLTGVTTTFLGSKSSRPSKPCVLAKRVEILVEFQSNANFIVFLLIKELMLIKKKNPLLGELCLFWSHRPFFCNSLPYVIQHITKRCMHDICKIHSNHYNS